MCAGRMGFWERALYSTRKLREKAKVGSKACCSIDLPGCGGAFLSIAEEIPLKPDFFGPAVFNTLAARWLGSKFVNCRPRTCMTGR